jgi:WD40 repeat protein
MSSPVDLSLFVTGSTLRHGGRDQTVRLWDPDSGVEITHLDTPPEGISWLSFSQDGRKLVAACFNGRFRIYTAPTPQQTQAWLAEDREAMARRGR